MKTNKLLYILSLILLLSSCATEFLDEKPDKSRVILSTLSDFEALLDRTAIFNQHLSQSLGLFSTDDYSMLDSDFQRLSSNLQRNAYIWNSEIFEGDMSRDWDHGYERIFYCNIALEGLAKIVPSSSEQALWNRLKGRALFHRAYSYYCLMVLFAEYTGSLDIDGLGIPLREESDINVPVTRSSLNETYARILTDLEQSVVLLGDEVYNVERPSKLSALMLLAKFHLYMQNYEQAWEYSEQALSLRNDLIDFNTVDSAQLEPFPVYGLGNSEVIFMAWLNLLAPLSQERANIDPALYDMYEQGDLRKSIYYLKNEVTGKVNFKGSYVGYALPFVGLSMNELYLIAMEASYRTGNITACRSLYDALRSKRFEPAYFRSVGEVTGQALLDLVLAEKRRELVMRFSRWEDLKRLNKSGDWSLQLQRIVLGETFVLQPNDRKYIFPIPDYVIEKSGIIQNNR